MKLTWFGGSTFRLQIGGQIVAVDAQMASAAIDARELVSGADRVVLFGDQKDEIAADQWKPRPAERLLDAQERVRPIDIWGVGAKNLLVDGDADMPLLLLGGDVPALGRWADKAVVVVFGDGLAQRACDLMERASPRLIGLAGDDRSVGDAFERVRDLLDGGGLVALERGMAIEA